MKLLALIPARGGSKGIPRKNIRPIAGRPLIAWTIAAARECARISSVVVSTEDAEIADVARAHGADVPFIRPAELARDETPGVQPVLHAIDQLPDFDAVLLLQPTSPLRALSDIEGLLDLAGRSGADSVVSICEPDHHPQWMYRIGADARLAPILPEQGVRRQDLPPVYALNGAIYFARIDFLKREGRLVGPGTLGYAMPVERSVDIDTAFDWDVAELLLLRNKG